MTLGRFRIANQEVRYAATETLERIGPGAGDSIPGLIVALGGEGREDVRRAVTCLQAAKSAKEIEF